MAGLRWKQDLVVILPTGSGKSAVVATIARLERLTVTAVLCPLRSLLQDWQRRLSALKYPFEVFSPSKPVITGQAPLVLVSLDATDRHAWRQAVASLRPEVMLNRYVIDEAHLVLTESSYRGVMAHVKELRAHAAQVVLLSATIPPTSIPSLYTSFNLAAPPNTQIIRVSSNRPELHFSRLSECESLDEKVSELAGFILMVC